MLADSVGLALLVVLDTLTPAERLAFVLHDLFAMPFTEVAAVLGRSTEATRQLASRARRRVRGAPSPDRAADLARQREVTTAFLNAARGGDLAALVALLDSDVTLTADAAAVPVRPADGCSGARRWSPGARIAASARAGHSQLALVDGAVGIVFAPAGRLQVVLVLTVSTERRITAIDVIADPAGCDGCGWPCCQRTETPMPGEVDQVPVVAIASGKGGVGKTTAAVNLALALSADGCAWGWSTRTCTGRTRLT